MNENDDKDDEVGYGRPPKHSQFKPRTSGNPKGRRPKARYLSIPRQVRRDILVVGELATDVMFPGGTDKLTLSQLVFLRIAKDAANGKPTAMRMWVQLHREALKDRLRDEPQVALLDAVHQMITDPTRERDPGLESLLNNLRKRSKKLY